MPYTLPHRNLWLTLSLVSGLSVTVYLFLQELGTTGVDDSFPVTWSMSGMLALSGIMVCWIVQNMTVALRYRLFTGDALSVGKLLGIGLFCEFISAITPSAVGGGGFVIWQMHHYGIKVSKATSIMLITLFLDELFLGLSGLFVALFIPLDVLLSDETFLSNDISGVFMFLSLIISCWSLILFLALFVCPSRVTSVLCCVFRLPLLRHWSVNIESFCNELVVSSNELRCHNFLFWLQSIFFTALSWIARFLVVNCVLIICAHPEHHFLIFIRQFIIWMLAMVTPMPGGSGMSEWMFHICYNNYFTSSMAILFAILLWRIINYYSYIIIGIFLLPRVLNRK